MSSTCNDENPMGTAGHDATTEKATGTAGLTHEDMHALGLAHTHSSAHVHAADGGAGEHIHDDLHLRGERHHHHSHTSHSSHVHGHHLLQVEDLSVSFRMYDEHRPFFRAERRDVEVIHDLSISVHESEVIAIVGASGSGKTLLADAILGLFEPNATVRGTIWFDGGRCDADRLARLRGHGISLVPQSVNNLDPLMKVGPQVEGMARGRADRERRRAKRRELFSRYGLDESVAELYPFELSGGMARRILLCCALMDDPRLIVADEPTPGLDLELALAALADFRAFADAGGAVLLITHDIELALGVADRVAVFQDGTVVEETDVRSFDDPAMLAHRFSRELWHALPEHDFTVGDSSPLMHGRGARPGSVMGEGRRGDDPSAGGEPRVNDPVGEPSRGADRE